MSRLHQPIHAIKVYRDSEHNNFVKGPEVSAKAKKIMADKVKKSLEKFYRIREKKPSFVEKPKTAEMAKIELHKQYRSKS